MEGTSSIAKFQFMADVKQPWIQAFVFSKSSHAGMDLYGCQVLEERYWSLESSVVLRSSNMSMFCQACCWSFAEM